MKIAQPYLGAIALAGLGLLATAMPALARPEIASGDQLLNTDAAGCLAAADDFIETLGIDYAEGSIDRTGYFDDGAFRILCYAAGDYSLAVVFATHRESTAVAADFIQMALAELAQAPAQLPAPAASDRDP